MKQWIRRLLHSLSGCPTCGPLITRQRRIATRIAHDAGHIAFFDSLAERVRRDRLQKALVDCGAEPWQVDLLTKLVDAHRRGDQIIAVMPPQHPQFGTRIHESIEDTL